LIPENLCILNHEVAFERGLKSMNFAEPRQQQELLALALDRGCKIIVLDNLSCLFSGIDEDKSLAWERVKFWLIDLRRHGISPVLVHHTGYNLAHMRGTSKREDDSAWAIRLDNKKESFEEIGAKFISRFTKGRHGAMYDYDWTFEPDPADRTKVNIYHTFANRAEIVLQWVRDGLTRCEDIAREMGLTKGRVSQLATQLVKAGKLTRKGKDYDVV
jgi:hypothetical protein